APLPPGAAGAGPVPDRALVAAGEQGTIPGERADAGGRRSGRARRAAPLDRGSRRGGTRGPLRSGASLRDRGTQQAFEEVLRLVVDPGESVWLEDPGYLGAQ